MVRPANLFIRRLAPAGLCIALAGLCAVALAACGTSQKPATSTSTTSTTQTTATNTVAIYSSLPESGPDAARSRQVETGITLALDQAHEKAGHLHVSYVQLCDSGRARPRTSAHGPTDRSKIVPAARGTGSRRCTGGWNQLAVADNAEKAARDPQTVAYIGDLNSGATALSLPILNQAGIVQVTPGSGYPGLTNSVSAKVGTKLVAITQSGEPGKYYPQGLENRTLLRMIPNDLVQASAMLDVLRRTGCQKFSAWNFGDDVESNALLQAVIATAPRYKMVDETPGLPKQTKEYEPYAQSLGRDGVHCALLVGHVTQDAVLLTKYLGDQLPPSPTIIGSNGLCNSSWIRGVPANVVARLYCTTPVRPVDEYRGHTTFAALYQRHFHSAPTPYSLYGYAAVEMLLRAIHDSNAKGDIRAQVLRSMVYDTAPDEIDNTAGQIQTFSFDPNGNLETNNDYGVDNFRRGVPQHVETVSIDSKHLLPSAG